MVINKDTPTNEEMGDEEDDGNKHRETVCSKCTVTCQTKSERKKIVYSVCIYASFFIVGWIRGLFGPAFIDIMFISNVDLKLGSWISTVNFIGYALGSVSGGLLYDRVNKKILYGACLLVMGILVGLTPFCYVFGLMAAVHFGQGVTNGIVDTAGNAEMLILWMDNKMMYFCVELVYQIGSFVSPIVVSPFTLNVTEPDHTTPINRTVQNDSYLDSNSDMLSFPSVINNFTNNLTDNNASVIRFRSNPESQNRSSSIYIPFLLTAGLCVVICLLFFVMYFFSGQSSMGLKKKSDREKDEEKDVLDVKISRSLPKKVLIFSMAILCSLMFLFLALGEAFVSYLSVFCVEQLEFSTADGALISSVSIVCGIVAVVVTLFLSCVNCIILNGIHIVGTLVGIVALLLCSIGRLNVGVWLSAGVVGYFKPMVFTLTFSWTNEYITPVTGKISSLFMINTCVGSALNPVLLGWLMEEYGNLWLCYLFIIEGATVLLLYVGGVILTKYVTNVYGKTYDKSRTDGDVLEIDSLCTGDNPHSKDDNRL